jgi:quercetin dioxygenase-like cupin family protein
MCCASSIVRRIPGLVKLREEVSRDWSAVTGAVNPHARIVLPPGEGEMLRFGGLGVRFMIGGAQTGNTLALVEHPIEPGTLAAPVRTHRHEGEYTFVLEGEIGGQIEDEVRIARPGDLVFKPRNVPHAFWNPAGKSSGLLEIISPAGFEQYFREIAPLLPQPTMVRPLW